MKRFALALSVMAVLSLAACTNGGVWTPMSDGRTAGSSTVEKSVSTKTHKADRTFNKSMHK
jgi:basic membrane lipoprotein Med (substrate-binding protein (PBP1-ABC) superfamily)